MNKEFISTIEKAKHLLIEAENHSHINAQDFMKQAKEHQRAIDISPHLLEDENFMACLYYLYFVVDLLEKNKPMPRTLNEYKAERHAIH